MVLGPAEGQSAEGTPRSLNILVAPRLITKVTDKSLSRGLRATSGGPHPPLHTDAT